MTHAQIEKKRNALRAKLYPRAMGEARIRLANMIVLRGSRFALAFPERATKDLKGIYDMLGEAMARVMEIGDGVILPSDTVGGWPESRKKTGRSA